MHISNKKILALIYLYLLGVPVVTSLNGLSMFMFNISSVGPLYHTVFSATLLSTGLLSRTVRKNWIVVFLIFGVFALLVVMQVALGLSDLAIFDLGQLYKWFMPLLLFAVYFRWQYFADPTAQRRLARLFRDLPLLYSIMIFISVGSYLLTGFNPALFSEGTLRFTGFTWGYNTTVNVFLICAYINFVLIGIANWRKLIHILAYVALNTKTAVAYFALVSWSFVRPRLKRLRLSSRVLLLVLASPILAIAILIGYTQSLRAADAYGVFAGRGETVNFDLFTQILGGARLEWYEFMAADMPTWPATNLIFGNGLNVDRRILSSFWEPIIGARRYADLVPDKANKTIELDGLGHLDLFGILGTICFVFVFYLYPLVTINQPYFRIYYLILVMMSMYGGHLINNPQTATLLVFFILFLRKRGRLTAYSHTPISSTPQAVRREPGSVYPRPVGLSYERL